MSIEHASSQPAITQNDARLISEAIDRLRGVPNGAQLDIETIRVVLISELQRGRRDLFSLVKAGQRAMDQR